MFKIINIYTYMHMFKTFNLLVIVICSGTQDIQAIDYFNVEMFMGPGGNNELFKLCVPKDIKLYS